MTLIQQLSTGKVALHNTGSFEDLRMVLKVAFPQDHYSNFEESGRHRSSYFVQQKTIPDHWINENNTTLPSYPTSAFIKELNGSEKMRTITHGQAQLIIDIACSTWKETLYQKWGKDIVFKKDINITEEYYQGMRKACTPEQNTLFDTIFGKDVNHLPKGTPCFVRSDSSFLWKLSYADGNGNFYFNGKKSGTTTTWPCVHEYSKGLPPEE